MSEFESLVGLVSQYSPSGQERGAVTWLVTRMKSLGFEDAFIDEAGNAVGVMGSGPTQIVLLGHIDTVPGEIGVRVEEGCLFGRGSVDAKGPLACFVDAVAKAGARDGWQFVVIGAVEEERDSDGARFIVKQYKPDFAIIGEPNQWDRVALGYKGSAWATITIKRPQAHTASGEDTAAELAVELWLKLKSYADSFNAEKTRAFDKLLVTLRGMDSNSDDFEQWAQLKVGVRLPAEVSPGDWYTILEKLLSDSHLHPLRSASGALGGGDGHLSIERIGFAVPAWNCEKNTPLVRSFLSGIRSQGGEPRFVYKTGTADLNIVAPAWKCPAVVFGPGDSALDHTPDEHINLQDYARAVSVLGYVLRTIK